MRAGRSCNIVGANIGDTWYAATAYTGYTIGVVKIVVSELG